MQNTIFLSILIFPKNENAKVVLCDLFQGKNNSNVNNLEIAKPAQKCEMGLWNLPSKDIIATVVLCKFSYFFNVKNLKC